MKKSILLGLGACALALGGVAAKLNIKPLAETRADTETILIEIGNNCDWNTKIDGNYGKLAVYFFTGTATGVWGGLIPLDGSLFYEYSYSGNSYESMIITRQQPSAESAAWSTSANQTKDLAKGSQVTVWDMDEGDEYKCYASVGYRSTKTASLTDDLASTALTMRTRNGAGNMELIQTNVAVTEGQKFKVSFDSNSYALLNDSVDSGLFDTTSNTGYITAKIAGTFDFYFDTSTHKLWVEANAATVAKQFSRDFNSAMATPCADPNADNKSAVSAIWSTWKGKFEALTPAAKEQFGANADSDIAQARATYKHCVKRYELDAWDGAPSAGAFSVQGFVETKEKDVSVIALASIGFASLAGIGFAVMARKRSKEQE